MAAPALMAPFWLAVSRVSLPSVVRRLPALAPVSDSVASSRIPEFKNSAPLMATTDPPPADSSDLQDLIGPVWRRKWLLFAIIVMSTVGTYAASDHRADRFRSSTQVFVSNSQIEAIVGGGGEAAGTDRSTLDQAKLLLSRPVTEGVIERLRLRDSPDALLKTVSAEPVAGSNFVSVSAERSSGAEAAAVANAYVQEYIGFRNDQLNKDAGVAIDRIRGQLSSLPDRDSSLEQRQDLEETIRLLQVTQAATPSQTRQTDRAVASGVPFEPKPERDAAFAFAISLGFGLALVFALERFDRRIKSVDEVAKVYGVPLLSSIPHTSTPVDVHDGKAAVPDSLREPFRSLRTNLQLASLDRPIKRIVVASAISGEGKSTIVRNLALTYREWGLSVVVLEADLRRPTLSRAFGVEAGSRGLTSVLTGDSDLEDALVDIDFDIASLDYLDRVRVESGSDQRSVGGATTASSSKLVLLPSGDTPPNPQAVLAADKTGQVVQQLAERFDVVLIDTPPLLAVSDAIPLLSQSDGVILVSRVGLTERPLAQRVVAATKLDPSVRVLGVVANDLAFQPGSGYGYGYGYERGYGYDSSNGHKAES